MKKTDQTLRFVPKPSESGRGLRFGLGLAAVALAWSIFQLARGNTHDPMNWTLLGIGIVLILIAWRISRGDRTEMDFFVGPAGIGREKPAKTAFELSWNDIHSCELIHEHSDNTFWLEVDPAKPNLFARNPQLAFYKKKTQRVEDPERYRILVNDGTDQMDEIQAALKRFGGRKYKGMSVVTIKEAQARRKARNTVQLRKDK